MDGPRDQTQKDKNYMISFIFGIQKNSKMNILTKQKQTHRRRKQQGRKEGYFRNMILRETYYHIYKT